MANNGWILEFKVSMEASWQNVSIFVEEKNSKFFYPKKDPNKFFGVQNMSHGNGSSAFLSQHRWKFLPVMGSMDPGLRLLHTKMVGCHLLYGSNFDFQMT